MCHESERQARAEEDRVLLVRERQARVDAERALLVREHALAAVSHDLKHPLAAMSGWTQLLLRDLEQSQPPQMERFVTRLKRIQLLTLRMQAQLDELLDCSRLQRGLALQLDRQPTDFAAQVRRTVAEYSQMVDGHRLRCHTRPRVLIGHWDAARLERVLANLLSNAIKYSPRGGDITISLRREEAARGPQAVLTVEDQGSGIPTADVPHVGEPFFRAHNVAHRAPGTGIGLFTAKRIVEQHGGTIRVESVEDAGTTFIVCLPLAAGRA